jgi:hypothetical protein
VQSGWWHYIHLAAPCPCLQGDCRYRKMASGEYEVFCDPAPIVGFVKLLLIFKEK